MLCFDFGVLILVVTFLIVLCVVVEFFLRSIFEGLRGSFVSSRGEVWGG